MIRKGHRANFKIVELTRCRINILGSNNLQPSLLFRSRGSQPTLGRYPLSLAYYPYYSASRFDRHISCRIHNLSNHARRSRASIDSSSPSPNGKGFLRMFTLRLISQISPIFEKLSEISPSFSHRRINVCPCI